MATNITNDLIERPKLNQITSYTRTPNYLKHGADEDKLAILVCQIKIWSPSGTDWFTIPSADSCLTLRECESVEITNTSKELINKAVVRFPRGTVIHQHSKPKKEVVVGTDEQNTSKKQALEEANHDGELLTLTSAQYNDDGVSTTSMAANYDDKGLIDFNRTTTDPALLSVNDVAIGQRIEIRLGYAYSETEYKEINKTDNHEALVVAFTGFITSISVSTPLELECTNMAHILNAVSTPNIPGQGSLTVKDFLDDDGKYHLLKDTGITLASASQKCDISVSGGAISNNLTVADVLTEWAKSGILCIMETDSKTGKVQLRVGLNYYTGSGGDTLPNNDKKYITYNGGINTIKLIQFDWDVANDKLSLKHNDKKYIAVEAHAFYTETEHSKKVTKFMKVTVRRNPDSDDEGWVVGEGEFQLVNTSKQEGVKKTVHKDGTYSTKRKSKPLQNQVKLKDYNVIQYFSEKANITQDELVEEAKQYWAKYNPNGISGSIEIFGDLLVNPTDVVGLIDMRQPEKNGYYLVEAVNTSFGVNGYRRELKLPHKIASFSQPVTII